MLTLKAARSLGRLRLGIGIAADLKGGNQLAE